MGFKDFFKKLRSDDTDDCILIEVDKNKIYQQKTQQPKTEISKTGKNSNTVTNVPASKERQKPIFPLYPMEENGVLFTQHDDLKLQNDGFAPKPVSADVWTLKHKTVFTPKPVYEKRTVVILAIENTKKVVQYRNEVMMLLNKIVEDNKDNLFMFLETGDKNIFFNVLDYDGLKAENLPNTTLSANNTSAKHIKLADALTHVCEFFDSLRKNINLLEYKTKKFDIESVRILFVGTGSRDINSLDASQASELLKLLCENRKVKNVKYVCIKDEDAINAAATGFPVIGHIESNFYK